MTDTVGDVPKHIGALPATEIETENRIAANANSDLRSYDCDCEISYFRIFDHLAGARATSGLKADAHANFEFCSLIWASHSQLRHKGAKGAGTKLFFPLRLCALLKFRYYHPNKL